MPVSEGTTKLKTAIGEWDFAVDGGAISTITLRGFGPLGSQIPAGSVILGGYVDVLTIVTSGGAGTAGISSEAASDLVAAAAVSGAPWSTTGRKALIPVFTAASTVKTTAARSLAVVIGAVALTAGKFRVYAIYQ